MPTKAVLQERLTLCVHYKTMHKDSALLLSKELEKVRAENALFRRHATENLIKSVERYMSERNWM